MATSTSASGGESEAPRRLSQEFVAIACNQLADAADWWFDRQDRDSTTQRHGLLAYAAGRFVALYDVLRYRVVGTLRGHNQRVNCVRWITETQLVSCASDGEVIVWHCGEGSVSCIHSWTIQERLKGHNGSATSLSVLVRADERYVVSTGSDCAVIVWLYANGAWKQLQRITVGRKMMECSAITCLPQQQQQQPGHEQPSASHPIIMALSGVEKDIHIYANTAPSGQEPHFTKLVALKGHADWIRCLSFTTCDNGDVLLASGAQDYYIRLWRFTITSDDSSSSGSSSSSASAGFSTSELLAALVPSALSIGDATTSISSRGSFFHVASVRYCVLLESVLAGHNDWVHSVRWHPPVWKEDGSKSQPMRLLSASMDKTMIIWAPRADQTASTEHSNNDLWMDETRVGELGGNGLGFFGGMIGPEGQHVLAYGYNGGFHLWKQLEQGHWEPQVTVSGHFGTVSDVTWHQSLPYLISVSLDETARLFAPWSRRVEEQQVSTWHELARPQIHGHGIVCLAPVVTPTRPSEHQFLYVSGSEEKIFRIFDAPQSFLHNFQAITGHTLAGIDTAQFQALGANVPSLGLSNKPVYLPGSAAAAAPEPNEWESALASTDESDTAVVGSAPPALVEVPPFEDQLMQSTLWPELHKLYGHGNDVHCVCASPDGEVIATACKGNDVTQSAIRVWETKNWTQVALLPCHKYTVIQMAFSHDSRYLLSGSRDRQFVVHERVKDATDGSQSVRLVHQQAKAHERIIWSCDWLPGDQYFVTGSRDKHIKVWKAQRWGERDSELSFDSAVTAVATERHPHQPDTFVLAVGLESGRVLVMGATQSAEPLKWSQIAAAHEADLHCETVTRLRWKRDSDGSLLLASCSSDQSVRVYRLHL